MEKWSKAVLVTLLCPCWFGVKELMIMDRGYCAGPMLFRIQRGGADGIELNGRDVVIAVDFPGPTVFDGNATVGFTLMMKLTQVNIKCLKRYFRVEEVVRWK